MTEPLKIFIDTEFTDFVECSLISIALVTETGEYFYGENMEYDKIATSDWVKKHVLPLCDFKKYGMPFLELSVRVHEWLSSLPAEKVVILADYGGDFNLLADLLDDGHPKIDVCRNVFLDFTIASSMYNHHRANAALFKANTIFKRQFSKYFADTKEIQHHALSDAKANAAAYAEAMKIFNTDEGE